MGILNLFSKQAATTPLETAPSGTVVVNRAGTVVGSTLPSSIPRALVEKIGKTAISVLTAGRKINAPFADLAVRFSGMTLTVRELRGGALIFLRPDAPPTSYLNLPSMSTNTLDEFLLYLETYIECWKQFNHYINLARDGKFTPEDEAQFLEVKSLVAQGLEAVLAAVEQGAPRKDEVMVLINGAPSLRYLAEHENNITIVESQWHKTFLILQSLLGRLKVHRQKQGGEWSWGSLFGKAEK